MFLHPILTSYGIIHEIMKKIFQNQSNYVPVFPFNQ